QARNFMRDVMKIGDGVLFYHSSCAEPGIAGVAEVASPPYADATQFDAAGPYFDPKSLPQQPRWMLVDVAFVSRRRFVPLAELRRHPALAAMGVLQKGSRLSITPVTPAEWQFITRTLMELDHER
ncbi:MAG TPA: EVE domain-containing protein, partial [Azospira sp.]|nr:EVE domain-containing protein [Azospira sp.]